MTHEYAAAPLPAILQSIPSATSDGDLFQNLLISISDQLWIHVPQAIKEKNGQNNTGFIQCLIVKGQLIIEPKIKQIKINQL